MHRGVTLEALESWEWRLGQEANMAVLLLSVHHGGERRSFRGRAKKQGVGGVARQALAVYFPGQEAPTAGAEVAEGTSW